MSLVRTHTPKPFNQSKVLMSYSVAICCFYTNTNKYMLKLYVPLVIVIIRSFPRSSLLTGFVSELTRATCGARTVHPSGAPEFTPVLVGFMLQDLLFSVWCFVGHWVDSCSSKCGFWIPLWYIQTFLKKEYVYV
jgi:hypothetical protein